MDDEMTDEADLAEWLVARRGERELSQTELARRIRVSQTTISNWERGRGQPDEVQLDFLRAVFNGNENSIGMDTEGMDAPPTSAGWGGEYPLDAVFVRTESRNAVDIVRRIRDKRYDLNPDFQRDFVWPLDKQSRLIESCLMRIPLPVLYVAEAPDGRIIVVDGLQRLSTFHRFLDGEFKLTFSKGEDETKHPLDGKRFADLDTKLQERIEDTPLTLYILDSKAPERAKLDIFDRVNSGAPLTRQQMRNCLHNGPATRWLKEAARSETFLSATGESLDAQKMRDREAINRFCAFHLLGSKAYRSGDMDSFLAEVLTKMNKLSDMDLNILKDDFDKSMILNFNMFGQHAFRKSLAGPSQGNRSVLNIALFDVCSVLLAKSDFSIVQARTKELQTLMRDLIEDKNFEHSITYSTNSRKQVALRFERMEAEFQKVLV